MNFSPVSLAALILVNSDPKRGIHPGPLYIVGYVVTAAKSSKLLGQLAAGAASP